MECARLSEEAGEALEQGRGGDEVAARLQARLSQEFAYESSRLGGGPNFRANLESAYVRTVSVSGPPLTDSFHFGQTVAYDFGRPFERGTNGQAGGSFSAAAGPFVFYVRAEYQHAPSAPALSDAVRNVIAQADQISLSQVRTGPITATNHLALLDAYAAVNLNNWELVIGRQSLDWGPSADDSMLFSDNIEPVKMVRLVNAEPFRLPSFLSVAGLVRIDQFFGRLDGQPSVPRPYIYGNKINFKPFPFLEIGLARTVSIGGAGSEVPENALNARDFLGSFFGAPIGPGHAVPGKNNS
jgi:hypothetical protein